VPGLAPMHGFAGRLELQFPSPLTWQSRCAPRVRNVSPVSWKGRATKHREACPVLQGQRPPRPQRIQYSPTAPVEVAYDLSSVPEPPPLNCSEGGVDDEDGDVHGVLSRVELSRYIARKNESLAALAEESRLQKQRAALGDGDWQGEVPGAHSDLNPGLEDAAAWRLVLEALSFERKHFKRGSSNTWPDGFLSPACLSSRDELLQLDAELTSLLPRFDAMDAPVCEDSLRALPAAVFMRQLLSDLRLALGNLHGAAVALAISKSAEPESADPLRPLLLIAWEDALDCDFLKAHHCFRLGRLAIISANAELLVAQELRNASPTKLQLRRAADHETAAANAALAARRLLQDAHRLFEEQIALHGQEGLHQKTLDMEEEWGISLRCGLLMTMLTQVQAFELLNRIDDKERTLSAAIKLSISLQAEREASPRLQRLLAKLRSELLEMKSAVPET